MKNYRSVSILLALSLFAQPVFAATSNIDALLAQISALNSQIAQLQLSAQVAGTIPDFSGTSSSSARVISAVSTAPTVATAPFTLTGSFSNLVVGRPSSGCFQVRISTGAYGTGCDTESKFTQLTSTIAGATQFPTVISANTSTLLPGTTYFFRLLVGDLLNIPGIIPVKFTSTEASFTTPPAPVAPVPVKATVSVALARLIPSSFAVNKGNQTLSSYTFTVTGTPVTLKSATFHLDADTTGVGSLGAGSLSSPILIGPNGNGMQFGLNSTNFSPTSATAVSKPSDSIILPVGVSTLTFQASGSTKFLNGQNIKVQVQPNVDFVFDPAPGSVTSSLLAVTLPVVGGRNVPSITLVAPAERATLTAGKTVTVIWKTNFFGDLKVNIDLFSKATSTAGIWHLATSISNTGSKTLTLPAELASGPYQLSVASVDNGPSTESSHNITIASSASVRGTLNLTADNLVDSLAVANVPNQTLGVMRITVTNEPVTVTKLALHTFFGASAALTNVTLSKSDGTVLAGPFDALNAKADNAVTFTDAFTLPVGTTALTIKGRIPSSAQNGSTIGFDTQPSLDWSAVGATTGSGAALSSASVRVFGPIVKNLALTVKTVPVGGVSSNPLPLVAGQANRLFQVYSFDATQSGEDVRFSSIGLSLRVDKGASQTMLSNCVLQRDGDKGPLLNSGSNVVNPVASDKNGTQNLFTFDTSLLVKKGTVVSAQLSCNVSPNARGSFSWGIVGSTVVNITGAQSSNGKEATVVEGFGDPATVSQSSLSFSTDSSSPGFQIVRGGQTNVTVGVVKFRATGEPVSLQRMGLSLPAGSPQSVSQLKVFDGAAQVGSAVFTGNSRFATSTFLGANGITIPRDADKTLTLKADFAQIGPTGSATPGDDIQFGVTGAVNTQGVGMNSGTQVNGFGTTAFASISLQKSTPVVNLETLPTTNVEDGRLMRFRVDAHLAGNISLGQFVFQVARSNVSVQNLKLFAFTDANYTQPVVASGVSNGLLFSSAGALASSPINVKATIPVVQIPAGSARFFELRATVVPTGVGSVSTSLVPDDGGSTLQTFAVRSATGSFVWSPNSIGSSQLTDADWATGFGVANFTVGNGFITQTRTGTGSGNTTSATSTSSQTTTSTGTTQASSSGSNTTTTTTSATTTSQQPAVPAVTLTAPASLTAGGVANVAWKITKATTPKDWISLVPTGATWSAGFPWFYTGGAIQGEKQIPVPAIAGTYDVVYLVNDGLTEVGRTKGIVVNATGATHTLSFARLFDDGQTSVGILWSVPGGVKDGDWIGIDPVGQPWKDPLPWIPVNGQKQASGVMTVPATSGQFQLVYYEKGMIEKARSAQIFVK